MNFRPFFEAKGQLHQQFLVDAIGDWSPWHVPHFSDEPCPQEGVIVTH
jgi:hypothetical protein